MDVQDFSHKLVHFRRAILQLDPQLLEERAVAVIRPIQEPPVQFTQQVPGPDGFPRCE